jgi:hypothetical protein
VGDTWLYVWDGKKIVTGNLGRSEEGSFSSCRHSASRDKALPIVSPPLFFRLLSFSFKFVIKTKLMIEQDLLAHLRILYTKENESCE